MEKKTETKKIDIHCACARGDLLEFAEVKHVKKTDTLSQKKILKKDDFKKKVQIIKNNH